MKKITKLILPVAGLGKRLLPLTLSTPKNLIKVNGRPMIEYALEETKGSSIEEVILVISPQHHDEFKTYMIEARRKYPHLKFHIRIQNQPFGNGHAVLQAADLLKNEPIAVRYPDDILYYKKPALTALIELFEKYQEPLVLLERVPMEDVSRYGVVAAHPVKGAKTINTLSKIVEKPKQEEAPSNLIIVGAYVVTPSILKTLIKMERAMPAMDDAIVLTDAFGTELAKGGKVYGWEFPGKRLDCGTLENYRRTEEFLHRVPSGRFASA